MTRAAPERKYSAVYEHWVLSTMKQDTWKSKIEQAKGKFQIDWGQVSDRDGNVRCDVVRITGRLYCNEY